MTYYLAAVYDNHKSFGYKAQIIDDEETLKLQSYSTIVAVLYKKSQTLKINGWYSPTTARHINEFLLQNGFDKLTKNEMEITPTLTKNQ